MLALRLLSYLALVVPSDVAPAPGLGGTAFVLVGPLQVGGSVDGEIAPFSYARWGLSSHLGLRVPIDRVELDVAATLGYGEMNNGGPGLLTSDPGAHGSAAFVGGRGGMTFVVFRTDNRATQLNLALILNYERDLHQYVQHYTYEDTGWFSGETYTSEGSARIGMNRTAIQLGLGLGFN